MTKTQPSFASSLEAAQGTLARSLRQLKDTCRGDSGEPGLAALRAQLDATRSYLLEHFRFEEHGGYMEAVCIREPRLERIVQHLGTEHSTLLGALDGLIHHARTTSRLDGNLREPIEIWIARVRAHEARETELVQNTYNQDLAAAD